MKISSLLLLSHLFLITNCHHKTTAIENLPSGKNDLSQLNATWELKQLEGENYTTSETTKKIELQIKTALNEFTGNDGCNRIFGDLTRVNAQNLVFGTMASTRMACEKMALSSYYTKLLKKVRSFSVTATELKLVNEAGVIILYFTKK